MAGRGQVLVLGSLNTDLVVVADRLPRPGETVTGSTLRSQPGGKGANQAVAAHRAGAAVAMHGAVGDDAQGTELLNVLAAEGVDTTGVRRVPGRSGTALVVVGPGGENQIVVVAGANDAAPAEAQPVAGDVVLLQDEVPEAANLAVARAARAAGATVVLNLAPFRPLLPALADLVDVLVVNESELGQLAQGPLEQALRAAPGRDAVVTVGSRGAYARVGGQVVHVPGRRVTAVDTTGAGDCFCGALAAALVEGRDLLAAVRLAGAAAALAVTRPGALDAMPTRAQIDRLL